METAMTSEKDFRARMAAIVIPEGFSARWEKEDWWHEPQVCYILEKPGEVKVKIDQSGSGHTSFNAPGGWKTFDRRGVEDSFYHQDWDGKPVKDLNGLISEQLDRVAKRLEFYKSAITLPGVNAQASPETVAQLRKKFSKPGATESFMPAGFGTGYILSSEKSRGTYRAPQELETLLGCGPLYISTFDAD